MTSSPLIAGVDVHRKTNTYCLMTQDGREVVPHFTLGNNRPDRTQIGPARGSTTGNQPALPTPEALVPLLLPTSDFPFLTC